MCKTRSEISRAEEAVKWRATSFSVGTKAGLMLRLRKPMPKSGRKQRGREAISLQGGPGPLDQALELANFLQGADHRKEQAHLSESAGAQDGSQLRLKELRMGRAESNTAPTHERIGLARTSQVGHLLVAA